MIRGWETHCDTNPPIRKILGVVMLRPLEYHTLEQMGKSSTSALLVLRSDVVPDIYRDHGDEVVFMQDNVQSIGQCVLF